MQTALEAAVPLWVMRLRSETWETLQKRCKECSQIVAEKGDIILFKSAKKGETAAAFNALAEGLAILSFCPGGVKFLDIHFENIHQETAGHDNSAAGT